MGPELLHRRLDVPPAPCCSPTGTATGLGFRPDLASNMDLVARHAGSTAACASTAALAEPRRVDVAIASSASFTIANRGGAAAACSTCRSSIRSSWRTSHQRDVRGLRRVRAPTAAALLINMPVRNKANYHSGAPKLRHANAEQCRSRGTRMSVAVGAQRAQRSAMQRQGRSRRPPAPRRAPTARLRTCRRPTNRDVADGAVMDSRRRALYRGSRWCGVLKIQLRHGALAPVVRSSTGRLRKLTRPGSRAGCVSDGERPLVSVAERVQEASPRRA